jgi:hypothetical protein
MTGRTVPAALLVVIGVMLLVWPRKRAVDGNTKEAVAGEEHPGGGDGGGERK